MPSPSAHVFAATERNVDGEEAMLILNIKPKGSRSRRRCSDLGDVSVRVLARRSPFTPPNRAGWFPQRREAVAAAEVGGFGFHCLAFASDCRRAALIALGSTVELVLRKPPFLAPRRTSRL